MGEVVVCMVVVDIMRSVEIVIENKGAVVITCVVDVVDIIPAKH